MNVDAYSWLIVGGIAGILAKFLMLGNSDAGLLLNISCGLVGAFIGNYVLETFALGIAGFNTGSILAETFGAMVIILVANTLMRKKN
ncbi:MAG: GlsB/YeaQ/YmgE family stress response membrane protein [Syntrophomonadaceae bacterium]